MLKPDQPGRVLTDDERFARVALPICSTTPARPTSGPRTERLAEQSATSWHGPAAAPIRLLPTDLDPDTLPDAMVEPDALPLGLRQDTMEPALLELDRADQHPAGLRRPRAPARRPRCGSWSADCWTATPPTNW